MKLALLLLRAQCRWSLMMFTLQPHSGHLQPFSRTFFSTQGLHSHGWHL
jgi:hypothetical protein